MAPVGILAKRDRSGEKTEWELEKVDGMGIELKEKSKYSPTKRSRF